MGLRLQIVLALAGLMIFAFGPLFLAVASLTRATLLSGHEQAARALCEAIAAQAGASADRGTLIRALQRHAARRDVEAVCFFAGDGALAGCAGRPLDVAAIRHPTNPEESIERVRDSTGRPLLEVTAPGGGGFAVARIDVGAEVERGRPLVRLVALYMGVFALALMVFAYFALTRLIVRPLEELVAAADRVASGARTLRVPRSGARELLDLGASVQAMAGELIAEEATLLLKIDELTETTTRLKQTQAQLVRSERLASVGRLAAGLAHEIGNPLSALMGLQELLLEGDLAPGQQRDFLQRMRRETERIHAVVRDLLDFARPEETPTLGGEEQAPADVRTVVDDVVSLVRPQPAFRSIRLEVDVQGSPIVAFPAPRLMQVLLNLVLNAGAAIARTAGHRIRIRAHPVRGEARVRIEIEDDGPGIHASVRDRLFEPFVTTKDVGEGTGLGLAVCRGLVESAGGEVGLDASFTPGARFYVVLPVADS
jgi:two-component system, NtrC family, sensor kinase